MDKKSDPLSMAADGRGFSYCLAFCRGAAACSSCRSVDAKSTTLWHTRSMLPLIKRGASLRSFGSVPVMLALEASKGRVERDMSSARC